MRCVNCGYENNNKNKFCVKCGSPLKQKGSKAVLVCIILVLIAAVIAGTVFFFLFKQKESNVSSISNTETESENENREKSDKPSKDDSKSKELKKILASGDDEKILEGLRKLIKEERDNTEALEEASRILYRKGKEYLEDNKTEKAVEAFKEAYEYNKEITKLYPLLISSYMTLADEVYSETENKYEAMRILNECYELTEDSEIALRIEEIDRIYEEASPEPISDNVDDVDDDDGEDYVPAILYSVTVAASDGYVNFRTGPGTNHSIICEIYDGTVLDIIKDEGRWLQINYDGQTGWIAASEVKKNS